MKTLLKYTAVTAAILASSATFANDISSDVKIGLGLVEPTTGLGTTITLPIKYKCNLTNMNMLIEPTLNIHNSKVDGQDDTIDSTIRLNIFSSYAQNNVDIYYGFRLQSKSSEAGGVKTTGTSFGPAAGIAVNLTANISLALESDLLISRSKNKTTAIQTTKTDTDTALVLRYML